MLLSVVINTYERPDRLGLCLEALERHKDDGPLEIVVVDDGGRADLAPLERLWSGRLPIRWLRIEHGGRSAARNRGVAESRGERIFFLGVDTSCTRQLAATHGTRSGVVGAYPWESLRGSPPFRRGAAPHPPNANADPADAGWMHFATGNLSLARPTFLRLNGFDERFPCYGWEDLDLGLRFERLGGRILFDPQARASHDHPRMTRAGLWGREREMGRTALIFAQKWADVSPKPSAR